MLFGFNVKLNDEDYILFNQFAMKSSGIEKKSNLLSNVLVILILLVGALNIILTQRINPVSLVALGFLFVVGVLLCLFSKKFNSAFMSFFTRMTIKGKDKKPYSPESVMEFYEDSFKEICPDNKSEVSYSAIIRVCVVKNSYVFLFIDDLRGYVIPDSCFENEEKKREFTDFLQSKCNKTEFFDKI